MLNWLFSLLYDLKEDNDRLKELDEEINSSVAKQMDELQVIEKDLTEHRKSAVKIPDLTFHKLGLDIIKDAENNRPDVFTEEDFKLFIEEYFKSKILNLYYKTCL